MDVCVSDDVDEIPNSVIAEAVNNAIAHRNYASIGSIQVEVYVDRIEIISPGRLHRAVTVADLYKKHESFATNPRIARAMYQVKYIETLGTGLTDLLAECKANGLKKPLLEEASGRFRVVIWRKDKTRRSRNEAAIFEKLVLAHLKDAGVGGAKLSDLQQLMPSMSRGHCQSVLRKLRKMGKIRSEGATSSARWFITSI